jgi:nuclear transcription factor Y gamma
MNSAQIHALSQIQAQAIVNARPSTALIAGGNTAKNAKPTDAQIQNQIQLQAQALVHAHTQAQIAAGIYKGGDPPKKGQGDSAAAAGKAAAPSSPAKAPPSPARTAKSGKPPSASKQAAATKKPTAKPAPVSSASSGAASSGSGSILSSLTPAQLTQQNQLSAKHNAAEDAISTRHASEVASLKSQFQVQNLASAPTEDLKTAQEAEMQKLLDKHVSALKAMKAKASAEMADLHATFRKQNAAAEYAGMQVTTVPNPTASGAAAAAPVTASSASADASQVSNIPVVSATPATLSQNQPTPMDMSGDPLDDDSGPVCSATSPEFLNKLGAMLQGFWTDQLREMRELGTTKVETEQDFKNHNDLPLARIKRIMKSDEDVRMISAEAPVLFAKACEMFILELSLRGWAYSENNKRRTLQKEDIKEAIQRTDILDFLADGKLLHSKSSISLIIHFVLNVILHLTNSFLSLVLWSHTVIH